VKLVRYGGTNVIKPWLLFLAPALAQMYKHCTGRTVSRYSARTRTWLLYDISEPKRASRHRYTSDKLIRNPYRDQISQFVNDV
jgi:hypothetical protein